MTQTRKSGSNVYGQNYGEQIPMADIRKTQWALRVRLFRKCRMWWDIFGPEPGAKGCFAPPDVAYATDADLAALIAQLRRDNNGNGDDAHG